MAGGCNLPCSKDDFEQIKKTFKSGSKGRAEISKFFEQIKNLTFKPGSKGRAEISKFLDQAQHEKIHTLREIIENTNHSKQHKKIGKAIIESFKEGQVSKTDENKIPKAIGILLKNNPKVLGIFSKAATYYKYASRMTHPGEAIVAAAIIQKKEIPTTDGNTLNMLGSYRVDFGIKTSSYLGKYVESDMFISQRNAPPIGVDIKYTLSPKTKTYTLKDDTKIEMQKVKYAIKSNNIQEYFYVSNGEFSKGIKDEVGAHNKELVENWAKQVKNAQVKEDLSIENINKNWKSIAQNHHIPQIRLCENVELD